MAQSLGSLGKKEKDALERVQEKARGWKEPRLIDGVYPRPDVWTVRLGDHALA